MDVDINKVKNVEPIKITELTGVEPLDIDRISHIAPVAAHIKEVNHIDPISVDALHVSEVKNIEPINVDRFNVTDLPMVNLSLRQIPTVHMAVDRLPAVSIGTHQTFQLPSNYTLRASLFGIEFFRIFLQGQTGIFPRERYRREQARTQNRSFPVPVTAGNPAIPSTCEEKSATVCRPALPAPLACNCRPVPGQVAATGHVHQPAGRWAAAEAPPGGGRAAPPLRAGPPPMSFHLGTSGTEMVSSGSVRSGG